MVHGTSRRLCASVDRLTARDGIDERVELAYPGTLLGVSEYFPGGCAHISSGIAVADTLGIFARMGVHLAAMWPAGSRLEFALGAIKLLRNADCS